MPKPAAAPAAAGAPPPQGGGPGAQPISGIPNLDQAAINLNVVREHAKLELIRVLDSVPGGKGLVLDPKLSGPLGLIAEVSLLKEHGVEKIYHLSDRLDTDCKNIVYLIRPRIQFIRFIGEHIQNHQRDDQRKNYYIFFVPRQTMLCERHLEEEGVYGDVTLGEFQLDLIPFEKDVLSLEMEDSFRECFLDGDRTSLFYVARSIMKLQSTFGIIPHIKGKGSCAKGVAEMLLRMRREMGADEPTQIVPEIDTLILIDRQTDMVTPMCTQLTYEGLIDEVFGINNGLVDLDPELVGKAEEASKKGIKKIKTPLNSNDKLFAFLRDVNFGVLGPLLNKKAKEIDEYYKKRYDFKTVSEIRDFMKGLGSYQTEHQSLRTHTSVAEHILRVTKGSNFHKQLSAEQDLLLGNNPPNDYIEECISRQEPLVKVLRLLVLYSMTNQGIKQKEYEFFKTEILSAYGYEYLFTLNNLERLGLIKKQEGKKTFDVVRNRLRLVVENINEAEPNDIAYVYSGYAPVSVRLVELANSWRQMVDVLNTLPGPSFEQDQQLPEGVLQVGGATGASKVHLVFFIGGVTFTEIAAIRWLSQQDDNREYIIATTKLINGDTLLSSLMENIEVFLPA